MFRPRANAPIGAQSRAKPRILLFSPVHYFKGGAERSLFDLAANPAVTPVIAAPAEGPLLAEAHRRGIQTAVVDLGVVANIRRPFSLIAGVRALGAAIDAAKALKAVCRSHDISLVHSNGLKAHFVAALARALGGRPVIAHVRDIAGTGAERSVWRALPRLCNHVILVSRACWPGQRLPQNVDVIHNGVALPHSVQEAHRESPMTIGMIGRLHPSKGLHLLLTWLRAAHDDGLRPRLIVRGSFSDDAPGYEHEIARLIDELSLADHVGFEGFVTEPSAVYAGLTIVCTPSHVPDPFPRAVMEGMAHGLLVMAFPSGGIPEMIEDGVTGVFVRDAASFTAALRRIADEPGFAARIKTAARRKVETALTLGRLHEKTTSVYARMLGRRAFA